MEYIALTTGRVPVSDELQHACRVPLAAIVHPLAQTGFSTPETEVQTADIARCKDCAGYINHLCSFERIGWSCSLCGCLNEYSIAANRRYMGGAAVRETLPELASGMVDAASPLVERDSEEPNEEDQLTNAPPGNSHTTDAIVVLVDACSSEEQMEVFKSALLAGLEGLSPGTRFGLASFGESEIALYEATPGGPCIRHIALTFHSANPTAVDLADVLPLYNFLAPVFTEQQKSYVSAAVEAVSAASQRNGFHRRPLGEALQAMLRYLGGARPSSATSQHNEAVTGGSLPAILGAAVTVLLSGPPNYGCGAVVTLASPNAVNTADEAFPLDTYFPEITAWTLPVQALDVQSHDARVESTRQTPGVRGWMEVVESTADLSTAASELGAKPGQKGSIRWEATEFYTNAGAGAGLLGISVDVWALCSTFVGLEAIAPVANSSGGAVRLYPSLEESALPQDWYKHVTEPQAFGCLVRLRSSPELRVERALGSRTRADHRYTDLYHLARVRSNDAYAFELGYTKKSGLASCSAVVLQLVVQYLQMTSSSSGQPSSRVLRRHTRILTRAFPIARSAADVYNYYNAAAHTFALTHQLYEVAAAQDIHSARAFLLERTIDLTAAYHDWITTGETVPASELAVGEYEVDPTFRKVEAMTALPRIAHALMWQIPLVDAQNSAVVRPHPDLPCALRMSWETLTPQELSVAVCPQLSAWSSPDQLLQPSLPASGEALAVSPGTIYLLDAYTDLVIYYKKDAIAPFPPAQNSQLMLYVAGVRAARPMTPSVLIVREGEEKAAIAFETRLTHGDKPIGLKDINAQPRTYAEFLGQIKSLVEELLQSAG